MPITVKERSRIMERIKDKLENLIGKKVRIRANKGRKVIIEREGQIEKLYPNIFVVKVYEKGKRVSRASFNFADILTGIVKISSINKDKDYFPWLSE